MVADFSATQIAERQRSFSSEPVPLWHRLLASLARTRFQIGGALFLAIVVPVLLRWGLDIRGWFIPEQVTAVAGSSVAIVLGLLAYRQLGTLPGVNESFYCVPTLLVSFLAVLSVLLMLRVEYNRFLFPSSYAITVGWVFLTHWLSVRFRRLRIGVVPGGDVAGLEGIAAVDWHSLDQPQLPPTRLNALAVDLREDLAPRWERFIADCALAGIRVFHVKQLRASLTGRLEIEHLSENMLGSINPDALYLKAKQVIDWFAALLALLLLAPALLLVAALVRLDSPGPALFRQMRMGFRGRPFQVYKFRTMRSEGAAGVNNARARAMTADNDSRITPLGRFLRRTRIDELPQILNILRGEMSWIGPRPEALVLSHFYEEKLPFYRYRHIVRPGISGWAQVNQGHVTAVDEVHEKLHYDFYYIQNFSPWLDILITLKTLKTVATGFGAK